MTTQQFTNWKIAYKPNITKTGYDAFIVDENNGSVPLKNVQSYSVENNRCILQTKKESITLVNVKGQLHEIFLGMHHNWITPPKKANSSKWFTFLKKKVVKDSMFLWCIFVLGRALASMAERGIKSPFPTPIEQNLLSIIGFGETLLSCAIIVLTISMIVFWRMDSHDENN